MLICPFNTDFQGAGTILGLKRFSREQKFVSLRGHKDHGGVLVNTGWSQGVFQSEKWEEGQGEMAGGGLGQYLKYTRT